MPRLKKSENRQRSLRACSSCRQRKEKCDGDEPCGGCRKRGLSCQFVAINDSPNQPGSASSPATSLESRDYSRDKISKRRRTSLTSGDSLLPSNTDRNIDAPRKKRTSDELSEAPVPKSARLLTDVHGKWIYIGDSASISFVQNVRHIVSAKLGECEFTNDVFRHHFLEQSPFLSAEDGLQSSIRGSETPFRPSYEEGETLLNQFFASTSCLMDIFDVAEVRRHFSLWITGDLPIDDPNACQYYLILAIGAQAQNEGGYDAIAERCYSFARLMMPASGSEEPSIQIIQCYMLISRYLFGSCRRNAAYMTFGVAVRAGYALGMNRADLYRLFPEPERQSRERIWRTLRVMDTFLSASLGRPPATSDQAYRPAPGDQNLTNQMVTEKDISLAMARLCPIFEKIQLGVYQNQGVSTKVAGEISQSFRDWASRLPQLPEDSEKTPLSKTMIIGTSHLLGAYHWSIILLTRPFLTFMISSGSRVSESDCSRQRSGAVTPTVTTFANACVDSAIRALEITVDLLNYPWLPRRMPFMLNYIFNASLAIGAAYFGDYDLRLPLDKSMDSAERLLSYMRVHDPQAARYAQILGFLKSAAKSYVSRRSRMSLQQQHELNTNLFGDVGPKIPKSTPDKITPVSQLRNGADDRQGQTGNMRNSFSSYVEPSKGLSPKATALSYQKNQQSPENEGARSYNLPKERRSSNLTTGGVPDTPVPSYMTPDGSQPDFAAYPDIIPTFSLLDDFDSDFFGNFMISTYPPETL